MANAIDLPGCTPEPLMGYLKALGLFRLVATQADPAARLSWANGAAVLHTTLDRDGLLDFFLNRYCPTPVLAPWNGGGGFQGSESGPVDEIIAATSPRLALYQQTIKLLKDSPIATLSKDRVMAWCRNELPDEVVVWLDACFVLTEKGFRCFPLLGTAGNDGRLDFTKNFMERLGDVISYAQGAAAPADSKSLLLAGLFANTLTKLKKSSIGQFNPGNVGGANARQGNFEADSRVNPWDFVLSVEGSMLFAGALARRLGTNSHGKPTFPFTVEPVAVGYGCSTESHASRAELWVPLWDEPFSLRVCLETVAAAVYCPRL